MWERRFKITGYFFEDVPFPVQAFSLSPQVRLVKKTDRECLACIATEDDPFSKEVEDTAREMAAVYSVISDFSVDLNPLGAHSIGSLEDLGGPAPAESQLTITSQRTDEQKQELSRRLLGQWEATRTVWERLRELLRRNDRQFLRVALSYHYRNGARTYVSDEGRFVDGCIALEALFNDGPQDISYKLAARASVVHSCSAAEAPNATFELLKNLYGKRNKIVHGLGHEVQFEDLSELRRILRACLRSYLGMGLSRNKPQILHEVDRAVANPASKEALMRLIADGRMALGFSPSVS